MGRVSIAAVGDVSTGFRPPESGFTHVRDLLLAADIRFAQVEREYSERGEFQQQAVSRHSRQNPALAADFKSVPFNVVSIASNHTGDWGPQAVEDTVATFRGLGIQTIGAGPNIAEARKPAFIERNGMRVALLGYVSVCAPQTWATETRAGGVPMRAHTFYEPYEYQPGTPPRIVTYPRNDDLSNLVADVRSAKQEADHVVVSLHWGVHGMPTINDYQPAIAHAAIDAGAAAILGHHAHQPQGIEIYKGAVIFYGLGNCSFFREPGAKRGNPKAAPNADYTLKEIYSIEPDPGHVFDFKRHVNEGGIAFIDLDRTGVADVTYVATVMNERGQPVPLQPDDPAFDGALEYLNWAARFVPDGAGVSTLHAEGTRFRVYRRGD